MSKLSRAIRETREYLELNSDPDATDDDALDFLSDECGKDANGSCSQAGTEYCDWECPFSS
jgi:hypothetical protein